MGKPVLGCFRFQLIVACYCAVLGGDVIVDSVKIDFGRFHFWIQFFHQQRQVRIETLETADKIVFHFACIAQLK